MKTVVRLGVPSIDMKYSDETNVLIDAVKTQTFQDIEFQYRGINNCYCNLLARNKLVYDINNDYNNYGRWTKNWVAPYDYFLSADDDVGFTIDAIRTLISMAKSMNNCHVVAGAYLSKWEPGFIVSGYRLDSGKNHCMSVEQYKKITDFPHEVAWSGEGMMLIPKKVLEQLPIPCWQHKEASLGNGELYWFHSDQSFASVCRDVGVSVYLSGEEATHCGKRI